MYLYPLIVFQMSLYTTLITTIRQLFPLKSLHTLTVYERLNIKKRDTISAVFYKTHGRFRLEQDINIYP